jgi:glucose-6-phosphate-specific signal transduction histidine kinase
VHDIVLLSVGYQDGHPLVVNTMWMCIAFISKYITIVVMLPWILMARAEYLSEEPWQQRLRKSAKEMLAADTLALLLSASLFVYWLHLHSADEARKLSYLAVFLPIAWLTLKPGWRAAALGGTPAILCVVSLLQAKAYQVNVESEAFVAFVVTCLFTLGARITAQSLKEEQDRIEIEQALQLARQSFQLSETRIRKTAQALQIAGTSLQLTQHQLLDRIHDVLPESEVQRYYRQAASMQDHVNRLVDSMYPSAWRQRGLSAALHETIADALREAAINYRCRIRGSLDDLTPGIHAAIYRLACESVMHINGQLVCSSIQLGVRSGATANGYWVALRVEGKLDNAHINDAIFDTTERDMLGSRLGAYGLGLLALRNHARLFGGELRSKVTENGLRLSYMLVDAINRPVEQFTGPQPWIA